MKIPKEALEKLLPAATASC